MNTPLAYLTLKTSDISSSNTLTDYFGATITNSVGVITNNRNNITWNRVDMRKVLGNDMFLKYNKFNIGLVSVAFSACGAGTATENNRTFSVKLKGLNFTNGQSNEVILTTISHSTVGLSTHSSNAISTQYFTFDKQDYIDFNINLHAISSDTFPTVADATYVLGQQVYNFVIIPVE